MIDKETLTRARNGIARLARDAVRSEASVRVPMIVSPPFSNMTEQDWREAVALWVEHAPQLVADLPPRSCPACGTVEGRNLFQSYDAHTFRECANCGCWYVPYVVDSSVFDRLFERSPRARALAIKMSAGRDVDTRDADLARIGGYLDELVPLLGLDATAAVNYLDVGCGVGHSLRAAADRGMAAYGIEVDTTALDIARRAGLAAGPPDGPIPSGPYHLISLWETLEHLAAPAAALARVTPLLAEDGIVAITVPNLNAPATRFLRDACSWVHGGYNTPGHVNLFQLRAITELLSRSGLHVLDADTQFSANPVELSAFLVGEMSGAFDPLAGRDRTVARELHDTLSAVWPAAALVERLTLTGPILQVIACRQRRAHVFAERTAVRRDARAARIEAEAQLMIDAEPDYKSMTVALQEEVNKRDEEVNKRDALVNSLSALLDEERTRYARTIEGRIRRVKAAVARRLQRR